MNTGWTWQSRWSGTWSTSSCSANSFSTSILWLVASVMTKSIFRNKVSDEMPLTAERIDKTVAWARKKKWLKVGSTWIKKWLYSMPKKKCKRCYVLSIITLFYNNFRTNWARKSRLVGFCNKFKTLPNPANQFRSYSGTNITSCAGFFFRHSYKGVSVGLWGFCFLALKKWLINVCLALLNNFTSFLLILLLNQPSLNVLHSRWKGWEGDGIDHLWWIPERRTRQFLVCESRRRGRWSRLCLMTSFSLQWHSA